MKKSKDFKTVVILLSVAAAIVLIYVIQGVYFSYSGKVVTEYIFETSEKQVVPVDSFAVRDENRTGGKKNISILTKSDNRVYVPAVSDSESVAKNQTIALSFKNEAEAQAVANLDIDLIGCKSCVKITATNGTIGALALGDATNCPVKESI